MPQSKSKRRKAYQQLKPCTIEAWLVSDDPAEQQLAKEALDQLGPEAANNYIFAVFQEEQRVKMRQYHVRAAILIAILPLIFLVGHLLHSSNLTPVQTTLVYVMMVMSMMPGASMLQERIVLDVIESDQTREIPLLIEALYTSDKELIKVSKESLTRLLPRLTFAERDLLSPKHRKFLMAMAKPPTVWTKPVTKPKTKPAPEEGMFICAILQALGTVRYEDALPLMQKIAALENVTPEYEEQQRIAAHYVAVWDTPLSAQPLLTFSEAQPIEEKQILLQQR